MKLNEAIGYRPNETHVQHAPLGVEVGGVLGAAGGLPLERHGHGDGLVVVGEVHPPAQGHRHVEWVVAGADGGHGAGAVPQGELTEGCHRDVV